MNRALRRLPRLALLAGCTLTGAALAGPKADDQGPEPVAVLTYTVGAQTHILTDADIADMAVMLRPGGPEVHLRLGPEAAATLAALTETSVGQPLTLLTCDAPVLSAVIRTPILTGQIALAGITPEQASLLGALWRGEGACPAPGTDPDPQEPAFGP